MLFNGAVMSYYRFIFLILLMNGKPSSNKYLPVGLISKPLIKNRKSPSVWRGEFGGMQFFRKFPFCMLCVCIEAQLAIDHSV